MKYLLIVLRIQNGEYRHKDISVHEIGKRKNKDKFADNYSKEYYGDRNTYKDGDAYFHNGGVIATSVTRCEYITKHEYEMIGIALK